jgi:hypothetical protein
MPRKSATHPIHNKLPMMRARRLAMPLDVSIVLHNTLVVSDGIGKRREDSGCGFCALCKAGCTVPNAASYANIPRKSCLAPGKA